MRPWKIRPLTLGLAERVIIGSSHDPLLQWRWWCHGILRLPVWQRRAAGEAMAFFNRQFADEESKARPVMRRMTDDDEVRVDGDSLLRIQDIACHAALRLGGVPDDWRRSLWLDVKYMIAFKAWEVSRDQEGGTLDPMPVRVPR